MDNKDINSEKHNSRNTYDFNSITELINILAEQFTSQKERNCEEKKRKTKLGFWTANVTFIVSPR
ncbi:MAG: hypothetical protein ACX932_05450 [Gammaproteobacteria bacterium]